MGLTKQYLRYTSSSQFSVIASTRCNVVLLNYRNTTDRYAAVANCENVCIWDLKTQERVLVLSGDTGEVTCMATSSDGKHLAIGRTDGSVQIYDLFTGQDVLTFNGHKTSVSALVYDEQGLRLATGSHDGDVVVWDLVDQKGLYRLKGHKGMITCCYFVKKHNMLITSSKDTNIKWWDLDVQFCFKTLMDHRAEVWQFSVNSKEDRLITGSADSELRVYDIEFIEKYNFESENLTAMNVEDDNNIDEENQDSFEVEDRLVKCKKLGSIFREGKDRVVSLRITSDDRYIVCHGNRRLVEIFRVLNEEELTKKRKKEAKKLKRKLNKTAEEEGAPQQGGEAPEVELQASDMILKCSTFRSSFNLTSIDVAPVSNKANDYVIVAILRNNQIQVVRSDPNLIKESKQALISMNGHRSESRSACFSSKSTHFITTGAETAKLWLRSSQQCIRTFPCNRPTCCLLVPGDLHLILGTAEGHVELYDVGSGDKLESMMAHEGGVSCVTLLPDKTGVATGGLNKKVHFYEFELEDDEKFSTKLKRLKLTQTRVLELEEQVLDMKFTADGQLLAVSLTDSSVLVFYTDSLRFKLKLYEHSLPVNSITISDDSTLIVSGSRDRNVIIWGLDYGNKHKKLFAHDNDVTKVEFVPETHLFFSCGKDGLIKQWDADKFILIQVLKGHSDAVWYVLPSHDGDMLLSSGQDRSLRLWERTLEIVIPEEEREQEREEQTDKNFAENLKTIVPGENSDGKAQMASKSSRQTVQGAEKIMEAIELYREESEKEEEFNSVKTNLENQLQYRSNHPILMAYKIDAARYVLRTVQSIKSSDLEEALLVIPFPYVCDLLKLLNKFLREKYQVELTCRCIFFLLKIHHGQITANVSVDQISDLQVNARKAIQTLRDRVGFNLAALQHIRRQAELKDEISIFADITDAYKDKKKKKRKGDSLKRNILAV